MLTGEQARELLDSIDVTTLVGLRDRALIAVMTFAFARIGAVVAMRVEDYYANGKRWWVRLHEKGGKRHEMPAHHNLEAYLEPADVGRDMHRLDIDQLVDILAPIAPGEEAPAGVKVRAARIRVVDRDGEEFEKSTHRVVAGRGDDRRDNRAGRGGFERSRR